MKKKFLFLLLVGALFISCGPKTPVDPVEPEQPENPDTQQETDNTETKVRSISIENQSSYPVSVYFHNNPETGVSSFAEIPAKSTIDKDIDTNDIDEDGSVFYFIYNLNFGQNNVYFPYYPEEEKQNHKIVNLTKENKVVIDEIQSCKTKSSFIFLENNTTSNIMLKLKYTRIKPYHKDDELLQLGETGVYEIGNSSNASFKLDFINDVKIEADAIQYDLPILNYEAGKIYTITVSNTEKGSTAKIKASLKAISPFNVDTARKMWGFSESSFLYNWDDRITPVIKPAYDKEKGSIMMGTLKNQRNKIGLLPVDQYGIYPETMDVLEAWTQNIPKDKVDTLIVSDFVEQSDGSFVMLLSCWDENYYVNNMLLAFDFSKNLPLWDYDLPEDILFRHDSANKLIRLEDNKVVIAGGIIVEPENPEDYGEDDPYPMSPYIGIFDYTKKSDDGLTYVRNEEGCKTYTMDTPFDNESLFCSVYYDGSNIFASGFTDFDPDYNLDHDHYGIIYKFNADLSEPTEIYKKLNCLFFTLSGNGNKWYACGEYWLKASDRLLGCYVSSTMIAEDKDVNPAYYLGTNPYTWFNQLCTYDNMIVMCGQSSLNKNGTESPLPFVVAYDAQGNMLWENLSYKKWATALNVIPNTIGTYILQLTDKNNRQIHFVSADFLGNEVID